MKRCSYCGARYSDDATLCAIDHRPLESSNPAPAPAKAEHDVLKKAQPDQIPEAENIPIPRPEDFRCLWYIDAVDADTLLKQFSDAGIRFKLVVHENGRHWDSYGGYLPVDKIDVHVHWDDEEKAMKIIAADWQL